jgi:NAD(P)-dependent dehydrogenase (short-subunit alcohol dehydrogenase family)
MSEKSFSAVDVPTQTGRTFVITGGNSGIGFEAARVLVLRGARVVLACRDAGKMRAAADALRAQTPGAQVEELQLDVSSLASIRKAAAELLTRFPKIDVLINNAGVMALPFAKSEDGFERQFATNHLGPFAFTGLVLPALRAAGKDARVVTTSSLLHKRGTVVFDDIPLPAKYDESTAYSASKLENVLFGFELDRRLKAAGVPIKSIVCHPGYSATNLQGAGPAMTGSKLMGWVMKMANAVVAQRAEIGALGTLRAATDPSLQGQEYVGSTGMRGMRGPPQLGAVSDAARDETAAKKLWEISEKLSGVNFNFAS